MAQKATHRQTSSAVPVVLFGVDGNGKPKAARFPEKQADLAIKAAGHLNLSVLQIVGPDAIDLAARLSEGGIHANGRGFVPYIRRDLYAKLVAAAGGASPGDPALAQAAAAGRSSDSASPSSRELPPSWDAIAAGHVVIAQDEPTEGWYEARAASAPCQSLKSPSKRAALSRASRAPAPTCATAGSGSPDPEACSFPSAGLTAIKRLKRLSESRLVAPSRFPARTILLSLNLPYLSFLL